MKNLLLALSMVLVGSTARADEKSEKQLHVLLHQSQKIHNLALGEGKLAIRIADLEQRVAVLEKRAAGAAERDKAYQTRIEILESKQVKK